MKVEMYIGLTDNTWHTEVVEIPSTTLRYRIEETAEEILQKKLEKDGIAVAFIGVYHMEEE